MISFRASVALGGEYTGAPSPGERVPPYLSYVHKECRLRPDQLEALLLQLTPSREVRRVPASPTATKVPLL